MTLRWTDEEERRLIAALNRPRNPIPWGQYVFALLVVVAGVSLLTGILWLLGAGRWWGAW